MPPGFVQDRVHGGAMQHPAVTALQEQGFAQPCDGADAIQNCPSCSALSVVKQQTTADTVRAS